MKNKLFKSIAISILIFFSINLTGCSKITTKADQENIDLKSKINNEETNLKEKEATALKDVEILTSKLNEAADSNSIQTILDDFYSLNNKEISIVYFGKENGEFYTSPKQEMPEDYDARARSWYIAAIKNEMYISKPYQDAISEKHIITVAKVISKDNTKIGVLGIDKFID